MIIDIHGHYTTEPPALHAFRDKQLAGPRRRRAQARPRRISASRDEQLRQERRSRSSSSSASAAPT